MIIHINITRYHIVMYFPNLSQVFPFITFLSSLLPFFPTISNSICNKSKHIYNFYHVIR